MRRCLNTFFCEQTPAILFESPTLHFEHDLLALFAHFTGDFSNGHRRDLRNSTFYLCTAKSTSHLCRLARGELQLYASNDVRRNECGQHAAKYHKRLANADHERNVVGNNQLAAAEVIHQVARLDDQGSPSDGVQESLVDLDIGAGDGGFWDVGEVLDVPVNTGLGKQVLRQRRGTSLTQLPRAG